MRSSLPMPKNGVMVSGCMHTPTTVDARLRRRGPHGLVDDARARRSPRTRAAAWPPPTRVHASNAGSTAGSTASCAPMVERERAARRREVGGDDRLDALQLQRGDDGQADRTAAEHERAVARLDARAVHARAGRRPSARSARRAAGRARSAPRRASAPTAACARRSPTAARCCRRGRGCRAIVSMIGIDVTIVPGAGPVVSGPDSSTSAENSWPMKMSRSRSGRMRFADGGHAAHLGRPARASSPPCLAKCRSDPQMPQAFTSHEHLAEVGLGLGDVVADEQLPVAQGSRPHDFAASVGRSVSSTCDSGWRS